MEFFTGACVGVVTVFAEGSLRFAMIGRSLLFRLLDRRVVRRAASRVFPRVISDEVE
ncbi:hypothetical protein GCM10009555_035000 [Acrocarpospora macrocephala]|uniref:Uncharacterized protein n=1 Tax=Acrocarpospora macrocephala TaxID=150177 RepID=A0A5M3WHZ8_9ACTN|nr:hypothetical protein [Acrocarpospora macrocephala]GES06683.1 hypothetical protein Amac_002780 [Acrocarpospora macrocephala]